MSEQKPAAPDLPRPIAELHLHLEGTLEPETIFALADRHGLILPYRDLADLQARYEFADLSSFLDLYYANLAVLQTSGDFETMTWHYAQRALQAGVRHAEVFVDPQAHTARGNLLLHCPAGSLVRAATSRVGARPHQRDHRLHSA